MPNPFEKLYSWLGASSLDVLPSELIERYSAQRRKLYVLLVLTLSLVGGLSGWWIAVRRRPMYEATALVQLERNALNGDGRLKKQLFSDQLQMMSSNLGLRSVAKALSAEDRLGLLQQTGSGVGKKRTSLSQDERLISILREGLFAERIDQTDLLTITFTSADPQLTANVANTTVSVMEQLNLERAEQRVDRFDGFMSGRLNDLEDEIGSAREHEHVLTQRLSEVVEQQTAVTSPKSIGSTAKRPRRGAPVEGSSGRTDLPTSLNILQDPEYASLQATLQLLTHQYGIAQRERRTTSLQADILAADSSQIQGIFGIGSDGLSEAISTAMSRYAVLMSTLGQNHPQALAEQAEVDQLRTEIVALRRSQIELARSRARLAAEDENRLRVETLEERSRLATMINRQVRNDTLYIEIAIDQLVLQRMEAKLLSARIQAPLNEAVLVAVSPAAVPSTPVSQHLLRQTVRAVSVGFLCALFLAHIGLLRGLSLWTIKDLEETARRPVLAVVALTRGALRLQDGPLGRRVLEGDLRAASDLIVDFHKEQSAFRLIFSSTLPCEGNTTAVAAFAVCLARAGKTVLVIDGNLHRPAMHKAFHLDGRIGLSQVLEGRVSLAQGVQTVAELRSLDVLTAGPVPPNPSSLFVRGDLPSILDAANGRYEFVLIDSPPLSKSSDARYLASMCQGAFVVARYGTVRRHSAAKTLTSLTSSQLLLNGLIVNGAPGKSA